MLDLLEDLPNLDAARKVNLTNVRQELSNLTKDFAQLQESVAVLQEKGSADPFSKKMMVLNTEEIMSCC